MDTFGQTIVGTGATLGFVFGCMVLRIIYRRCCYSPPPVNTPLPPSAYEQTQVQIQQPLPQPMYTPSQTYQPQMYPPQQYPPQQYSPQQQYVVYIPPQQGYSSYPQQQMYNMTQPPLTQPYPTAPPYQV
jgi:hypothetical protein